MTILLIVGIVLIAIVFYYIGNWSARGKDKVNKEKIPHTDCLVGWYNEELKKAKEEVYKKDVELWELRKKYEELLMEYGEKMDKIYSKWVDGIDIDDYK